MTLRQEKASRTEQNDTRLADWLLSLLGLPTLQVVHQRTGEALGEGFNAEDLARPAQEQKNPHLAAGASISDIESALSARAEK